MFGSTNRVEDSRGGALQFKGDRHLQGNVEYRAWLKSRTGDRFSDRTLDRLFVPDHGVRYLHFFDANRLNRTDGISVLACDGSEKPADRWTVCEKVAGTDAYGEGVVTSSDVLRSNDRPAATPTGSSTTR